MSVTEPQGEEPEHDGKDHGREPYERPDHDWLQIIINAKPKEVDDRELTYDDILILEYDGNPPSGPNWSIVVTYSRGPAENPQGTLNSLHAASTCWIAPVALRPGR